MNLIQLEVFFSAVDSLYFRGSRPHSAAGASRLPSDFPPSVTTLVGSLRTRLGDTLGVNWSQITEEEGAVYGSQEYAGVNLAQLIGGSKDTGLLDFSEPRLYKNGERLYAVPAVLLQSAGGDLVRLELGGAVKCDLGYVRLPQLPSGVASAKPLDNAWLTQTGMRLFLEGKTPDAKHIIKPESLFHFEERLGIGRDARLGVVKSGLLYQTEHVRLESDVEFSIVVDLPEVVVEPFVTSLQKEPLQRLGGEGRMAYVRVEQLPQTEQFNVSKNSTMLVLLTDMLAEPDFNKWPIKALKPTTYQNIDCWEGELSDIPLRLLAVACAKTRRIGGWDVRHNRPRTVQSYIPAGSCFFIESMSDLPLHALQGYQLGRRTDFGFGTVVCAS